MTSTTEKAAQRKLSHDFNHTTAIGLKVPQEELSDFYGYSELSQKILHDFIRPDGKDWLIQPNDPIYHVIQREYLLFERRCYNLADKFIQDYNGGSWKHNEDGIFCIDADPTKRFHIINAMNYSDEECNPLETGLAITLIALDGGMNSANNTFAQAMIYFRSTLMQLIEEQYEADNSIINTTKIIRLID